ncbi:MAG: Flp pilus assembly complex ATPase component TadA, partial [Patescibacteria group bacterium]|nr:Flp pilus assembly complex ATPase component TadA [Patescibacteria group bacterium]
MDDNKARQLDEQATLRRARIVGVQYFDTSQAEIDLYKDFLSVEEIRSLRIMPLYVDAHLIRFGITNATAQ